MTTLRAGHRAEVLRFLQQNFPGRGWELALPPHGTGHETYFARAAGRSYFVKLGGQLERYQVMGAMGLAPASLLSGTLEAGISILVQEKIEGHLPTRKDFRDYLPQFAEILRQTHQSERLKQALPSKASQGYREAGLETLEQIALRWESYKSRVTASADFVDQSLAALRVQLDQFQGAGLVASHNDVCNGNWLVSREGRVYLLDYESMSLDDPALDLGAILWWYYPPPLWEEFLARAGYAADQDLRRRMQVRMALHCLNILLPRAQSFDRFDPSQFDADLVDFRAALAGQANPQGYDD